MDGMSLRPIPFDRCDIQTTPPKREPAQKNKSRASARRKLPPKDDNSASAYFPLAEKDQLFFHILSHAAGAKPAPVPADRLNAETAAVGEVFRQTFTNFWTGLPESDRLLLLDYWRTPPPPMPHDLGPSPRHRPIIQVIDVGLSSTTYAPCDQFGHELNFSASLIREQPHRLPLSIASNLAQVFLYASREHWALYLELVEEPMNRWERRHGANASDAEVEKKLGALETQYLRHHESAIVEVLDRWGFRESEPNRRQRTAKKRGIVKR